jgi:hypothetical protein
MNGTSAFNILRRRSIRFAAAVAICALLFTGCSSTTSNAVNNDKVEADNITDITPASVPAQVSETAVGNKDSFEESDMYKTIEGLLDKNFDTLRHSMRYNRDEDALEVYFEAPENLKAALDTKNGSIMESWDGIVESMKTFGETLLSVVQMNGDVETVNRYWVEKLNSNYAYTANDYVLWVQNGDVMYNYADSSSTSSVQPSGSASESVAATFGEQNALSKAYQYLQYSAFSYTGLIEQLEFEGYSHSEAVYAADNCGADWNEQAVKKAKQYLEHSSFSRSGLIDQLEFEGFTHSQAEYAAGMFY